MLSILKVFQKSQVQPWILFNLHRRHVKNCQHQNGQILFIEARKNIEFLIVLTKNKVVSSSVFSIKMAPEHIVWF